MTPEHTRQMRVFSVVTALFCIGGGVLIVLGFGMIRETRAFIAEAESASGTVVGFETKEVGSGSDIRDDLHFAVVVYALPDGREIRCVGPSKDGLVRLRTGDAVEVLYPPDAPEDARVDSFMGLWFAATMLLGFGAAAVLVPLLTLRQAWKWCERQDPATRT